ncbi:MAG: FAD-dependent thymidylate synthase [Candidatus Tectomicrobia bacterium]|uniref:FAD-dependent thymidylate synthase n=1 Tax=Tectimicrobiota bacterium TaxID=2528274 RepID=A0A932HYC7_UNCTE|nr:FAD-dependent thymidylate synthase [Candidatus Tectomicrobia bacterium]
MRILLAGHNIDIELLRHLKTQILEPVASGWEENRLDAMSEAELRAQAAELQRRTAEFLGRDNLTPESISAAYARISRDPRALDELRAVARDEVEKARKSNQTIIFEYGHSSVAEHACFNIDVMEVSRYAVEEIEKFRLLAYTEKSQRYILLEDDFVIPREIEEAGLAPRFAETIKAQNACYHRLYEKLRPWVFDRNPDLAASKKNHKTLEGWAKEDARYIVSLATETQVGMTLSARSVEHVVSRCASHPLAEVREYGRRLFEAMEGVAPSLVKYVHPTPYNRLARAELREAAEEALVRLRDLPPAGPLAEEGEVALVDATPEADALIAAALLHSGSRRPMGECLAAARAMGDEERRRFMASTFRHMKSFDPVLREFENARCVFEITLSAACFGQIKRHRMSTLNVQPYDPALGVTVPVSIVQAGAEGEFRAAVEETDAVFFAIADKAPLAAPYVLTNAHRRRVLFTSNVRELCHVSRLREDPHAQWDIRDKAAKMLRLARRVMPGALQLAVGKHQFAQAWEQLFPGEAERAAKP